MIEADPKSYPIYQKKKKEEWFNFVALFINKIKKLIFIMKLSVSILRNKN